VEFSYKKKFLKTFEASLVVKGIELLTLKQLEDYGQRPSKLIHIPIFFSD
jgi:hypothetical protein